MSLTFWDNLIETNIMGIFLPFSGYSGWSGWSGQSGWLGASGWSGASGYSGRVGWQGFSGWSGQSGWSGISGWSATYEQFRDSWTALPTKYSVISTITVPSGARMRECAIIDSIGPSRMVGIFLSINASGESRYLAQHYSDGAWTPLGLIDGHSTMGPRYTTVAERLFGVNIHDGYFICYLKNPTGIRDYDWDNLDLNTYGNVVSGCGGISPLGRYLWGNWPLIYASSLGALEIVAVYP